MSPPTRSLVRLCAALALTLPASAAAQEVIDGSDPQEVVDGTDGHWAAALERDAQVGFNSRSGAAALAALDSVAKDSSDRAAALLALGASGTVSARPTLELWASEGVPVERIGAIFGLGELRGRIGPGEDLLVDLLQHEDAQIAESALLALLRTEQPGWRELVVGISSSREHRLSAPASAMLAFRSDPRTAPPSDAVSRLLALRYEAAKQFGVLDGQAWAVSVLEELRSDAHFLDQVVLISAAEIELPGVKDHMLELLLAPGDPERLRAVVRVMPFEIDQLIEAGLWKPASLKEWEILVDEAVDLGVAALMPQTLRKVARLRPLAPTAAALIETSDGRYQEIVNVALASEDDALRERAARAAGESRNKQFLGPLKKLDKDPAFRVRAASWVARVRLRDDTVRERIVQTLTERGGAEGPQQRRLLLDALARGSAVGPVTDLLVSLLEEVEGLERADIMAMLAVQGRAVDGTILREHYPLAEPGSPTAHRLLRGLSILPSAEDLDFLGDLFPYDGDFDTNVVLAIGLARNGHAGVLPVLQAAVWSSSLHRSVLAAAVIKESSGMHVLAHWVLKPPPSATSADIRRLGFAIGEWGGLEALDRLSTRMGGAAGAGRPALQGALLGALSGRSH